ncbi:MAG: divergent polysaccharide deacetylase family protein [Magnetovibrionaceae bacterium]
MKNPLKGLFGKGGKKKADDDYDYDISEDDDDGLDLASLDDDEPGPGRSGSSRSGGDDDGMPDFGDLDDLDDGNSLDGYGGQASADDDDDDFPEFEELDFGHDDDDDDDFDSEGGGKSFRPGKKSLIIGGAATGGLVVLGVVAFLFLGGDDGQELAKAPDQPELSEQSRSRGPSVQFSLPPSGSLFRPEDEAGNQRSGGLNPPARDPASDPASDRAPSLNELGAMAGDDRPQGGGQEPALAAQSGAPASPAPVDNGVPGAPGAPIDPAASPASMGAPAGGAGLAAGLAAPPAAPAAGGGGALNQFAQQALGTQAGLMIEAVSRQAFNAVRAVAKDEALPPVPLDNLVEQSADGPLPTVDDGETPFQEYARPFDGDEDRPTISIIMSGLGLSRPATQAVIEKVPSDVTLAFDPYSKSLTSWVDLARQNGHEMLLVLPMESDDFPLADPGPRALVTSSDPAENLRKLNYILSRMVGYVGVLAHMGSRFNRSEEQMPIVLTALNNRGLMIVDENGGPGSRSLVPTEGFRLGIPRAMVDLMIDKDPDPAEIDAQLNRLEDLVRENGTAVGLVHPIPVTLQRLNGWIAGLAEKGIQLAPISALADTSVYVEE